MADVLTNDVCKNERIKDYKQKKNIVKTSMAFLKLRMKMVLLKNRN